MKIYISNLGMPRAWLPPKLLLIMKLIVIILITCLMQVSAHSVAQKLTYVKSNATIKEVFKEITKQTGYEVLYANKIVNDLRKINADFKSTPLKEVLDKCLEKQDLIYSIDESKGIVIKEKEPSLLDKLSTVISNMVRDLNVKGRVVDQDGKPLPNASIRVKGKSAVINTNQNGEFEIKGVADDAVLLISYVGFKTLELQLKDAVMPLDIKLNVATGELEEVNVTYSTGYQNISKERATGSFVTINNRQLNQQISSDVLSRIEGIAAGVLFDRSRVPNYPSVSVRGINTIQGNKDVLIVLDNFPYEGDIDQINPNDIENITILKDAAAASIWGARAANGVIVITTKKGEFNRKASVQFNSNVSIQQKPDLFYSPEMTTPDFIEWEIIQFNQGLFNGALNSSSHPSISPVVEVLAAKRAGSISETEANLKIEALKQSGDVRDDYLKYYYRKPIIQRYVASVNGGSANVNYYISSGYDKNQSNITGNQSDRLSLRMLNTYIPFKQLELSAGISFTQSNVTTKTALPFGKYPYECLADGAGNALAITKDYRQAFIDQAATNGLLDWQYRPLDEINELDNRIKASDYLLNLGAKYKLPLGFSIEAKYQYEKQLNTTNNLEDQQLYQVRNLINQYSSISGGVVSRPIPVGGILDMNTNTLVSKAGRMQVNYNKSMLKHELSAFAGAEIRTANTRGNDSRLYGYNEDGLTSSRVDYIKFFPFYYNPALNGQIPRLEGVTDLTNRNVSYYGNAGYTYDNRYTVSASFRQDATNFFGLKANQKWQPLWSAGVAWQLSSEKFYHADWLPLLKLRATYGYNGNMGGGTYYTTASYETSPSTNLRRARISTPPNPSLKWEKVRNINVAVDFGLKNGVLNGSIEYYRKKMENLIGASPLDPTAGFEYSVVRNYASMKGDGVDITLNTRNINRMFKWSSTILFSYNSSTVTRYFGVPTTQSYIEGRIIEGMPLFENFAYRWAGLDPATGDPQGYYSGSISKNYADLVGNAKIDDLVRIGPSIPPYFGSIGNTFSFKGISVSVNLMYKAGHYFKTQSFNPQSGITHRDFALRWQHPGDENYTSVPSIPPSIAGSGSRGTFYTNSEILFEKADHLQLQYINAAYELNKQKWKRLPFASINIFMNASNLGVIWKANNKDIHPDFTSLRSIPSTAQFSMGLNIGF